MTLADFIVKELKSFMQQICISVRHLRVEVLKIGCDNSIDSRPDFRSIYGNKIGRTWW